MSSDELAAASKSAGLPSGPSARGSPMRADVEEPPSLYKKRLVSAVQSAETTMAGTLGGTSRSDGANVDGNRDTKGSGSDAGSVSGLVAQLVASLRREVQPVMQLCVELAEKQQQLFSLQHKQGESIQQLLRSLEHVETEIKTYAQIAQQAAKAAREAADSASATALTGNAPHSKMHSAGVVAHAAIGTVPATGRTISTSTPPHSGHSARAVADTPRSTLELLQQSFPSNTGFQQTPQPAPHSMRAAHQKDDDINAIIHAHRNNLFSLFQRTEGIVQSDLVQLEPGSVEILLRVVPELLKDPGYPHEFERGLVLLHDLYELFPQVVIQAEKGQLATWCVDNLATVVADYHDGGLTRTELHELVSSMSSRLYLANASSTSRKTSTSSNSFSTPRTTGTTGAPRSTLISHRGVPPAARRPVHSTSSTVHRRW